MNEFDKILRDNLKDGKRETPAFVWENIEQAIDPPRRKRGLLFWLSLLGLLLLLGGSAAIFFLSNATQTEAIIAQTSPHLMPASAENKPSLLPDSTTTTYSEKAITTTRPQSTNNKSLEGQNPYSKHPDLISTPQDLAFVEEKATKYQAQARASSQSKNHPTSQDDHTLSGIQIPQTSSSNRKPERQKPVQNQATILQDIVKNVSVDSTQPSILSPELSRMMLADSLRKIPPLALRDSTNTIDSPRGQTIPFETPSEQSKPSKFFIEAKLGYSAYQMSVWDESFLVGALSGRPFQSSAYNINLETGYEVNRWFNPILGVNYNLKRVAFTYDALYDDQGYFDRNIHGNAISIDDINNEDHLCNKFILEDIEADFIIRSYSITLGNKLNLVRANRLGMDLDLKYNLDMRSSVVIKNLSKIDVSGYLNQSFSSRMGAGLNLHFKLSERTKLFIYPEYIFMPQSKDHKLYKGQVHEFITSVGIRVNI